MANFLLDCLNLQKRRQNFTFFSFFLFTILSAYIDKYSLYSVLINTTEYYRMKKTLSILYGLGLIKSLKTLYEKKNIWLFQVNNL